MARESAFVSPVAAMNGSGTVLQGKKALVTGASRGIGRGIAIALGERGAKVYAAARGKDGLAETAARVRAVGGECVPLALDLSDDEAVEALWRDMDVEGPLDLVVNCAYSAVNTLMTNARQASWRKSVDGTDETERPGSFWDVVNGVGLRGVYVGSVYALRHFASASSAGAVAESRAPPPRTLVNVSSWGGAASIFDAAYCTGKSGVDRLTSELAREAPPGVTVLTYYPGVVATEKFEPVIKDERSKLPIWNAESPLFVGRALAAALPDMKLMRSTHGKIVVTAELAKKVGAVDEKGYRPLSMRSLRFFVLSASPKSANSAWVRLIPDVCVPYWLVHLFAGPIKFW